MPYLQAFPRTLHLTTVLKEIIIIIQRDTTNPKNSMNAPQKLDPKSNDWEVGFFMAKYNFEFKKMVVKEYLEGKGSTLVNYPKDIT